MRASGDFPFLTLPDPLTTGEGALDPLGLATIGDRLADRTLPGLRARMSRPRFVTAIAVAAAVCEGMEERVAADDVTPAYIVFEWLLVEAFVRVGQAVTTKGTPGTMKAQRAKAAGVALSAKTYLHVPGIFGFHGVYKPLARHLGIVDDDMRLGDNGYALLKEWQQEQGLPAFLESSVTKGPGSSLRQLMRSAVEEGLASGHSTRTSTWQGWGLLAKHLAPGTIGVAESAFIHRMVLDQKGGTRGEVFQLLEVAQANHEPESNIVRDVLIPDASEELRNRLTAIAAYESVGTLLEDALDWIRHLSSMAGARAITAGDYGNQPDTHRIATELPRAFRFAEEAFASSPLLLQQQLAALAKAFDGVRDAEQLFESVLAHHGEIQKAKKPDGKREWFERGDRGATFVRVPYRLTESPKPRDWWSRPYRINTARSFLNDLQLGAA